MLPQLHKPPPWHAPRLVIASTLVALAIAATHHTPLAQWPALLTGMIRLPGAGGETLGAAMYWRAGPSFVILAVSALLGFAIALLVAFITRRIGFGLPHLAGLAGRALAVFPVAALGWGAVGLLIGKLGLPIESLLPGHTSALSQEARVASGLWWWLVPVWLMTIPQAGALLSEIVDRLSQPLPQCLVKGLRARGLGQAQIRHRHELTLAWPALLDRLEGAGILALGYLVVIEDALRVPGWGAFVAEALRAGDAVAIAGGVYFGGWLAAAWSLVVFILRRMMVSRHAPAAAAPWRPGNGLLGQCATLVVMIAVAIVLILRFGGLGALDAMRVALQRIAIPLSNDLIGVLCAVASAGGAALVFASVPKPGWVGRTAGWLMLAQTTVWSPLLLWAPVVAALAPGWPVWAVLAAFTAFEGASLLARRRLELESSEALAASRALGSTSLRAWRLHVLPGLLAAFVSWLPRAAASALLWLVLARFLLPGPGEPSLGGAIAAAGPGVLDALPPLLEPAVVAAISTLCLWELSRMIRAFTSHQ